MNEDSIRQHIRAKIDEWLLTLPGNIKTRVENQIIVTGGCIVSMLQSEQVNDYDVYLFDDVSASTLAEHYCYVFKQKNNSHSLRNFEVARMPGNIVIKCALSNETPVPLLSGLEADKTEKEEKYVPKYISANAITLSNKVQVITRFVGRPHDIHKFFDYIHCTCYWTSWNNELVIPKDAAISILTKDLKYQGSKYPICSILRMRKFLKRGWTISAGQVLKILLQTKDIDFESFEEVQEQLTGVDVAYFAELLERIRDVSSGKMNPDMLVHAIEDMTT